MHAAIGAGRWRLLRQMLVESLVLAALACGAGLALAAVTIDLVAAMGPRAVSQLGELSLDARVVCFAMALAAGTVLLFGFWPAVQLSRPASGGALHEGSLRATASRGRRWFGGALVVAEVALALVLAAGEGYWPDGDALDRRLTVSWQGRPRTVQIVGVVGALRHDGLDAAPRPEIFLPFDQMPFGSMTFVVRATGDAAALVPSVKARIWEVDPTLPFYDVATLDGLVAESLTPRRVMMQLLGALAGLAFVLAAAGLYGLLSFSTAQRTREIGVRMAMGARTRDILRLVVGEGLVLVGVGVLVGLAGALAVTRVLAASLFQVSPTDPVTFMVAMALLFAVGLLACYLPARRAAPSIRSRRCESMNLRRV